MGSVNSTTRFIFPDCLTYDYLIPYALSSGAIAVGIGDLMYDVGSGVAYPADQQASQGSEAADQAMFANVFCGVSQEAVLSTETNALKRITLMTDGVCLFKCPSQTWSKGDLIGVYSTGSAVPDAQQVDKVTNIDLAIGVCVKDETSAVTQVVVRVIARRYSTLPDLPRSGIPQVVAASGTAIGNAAKLPGAGIYYVTNANNSAAVQLPPAVAGRRVTIINGTAGSTLQVFPTVNVHINGTANNAVYNIANAAVRTFDCINTILWATAPETIA